MPKGKAQKKQKEVVEGEGGETNTQGKKRKGVAEAEASGKAEKEEKSAASKRSRKCCAYQKALRLAKNNGATEEEAREKAKAAPGLQCSLELALGCRGIC